MNNKKKINLFIIMVALVTALGSAVVLTKLDRDNKEEVNTGDYVDNEYKKPCNEYKRDENGQIVFNSNGNPICEEFSKTIDGDKLVYKDNSVSYSKYVVLDYIPGTDYYQEETYYWFNTEEEYKEAFRELKSVIHDYSVPYLMIYTIDKGEQIESWLNAKVKPWIDVLEELRSMNITIIR